MKILSITKYQKKQVKPSFKGEEHFNCVKRMPNMICALCGEKTLPVDTFIAKQTSLCKSLGYNMKQGALDCIRDKYPQIWEILSDFAETYPDDPVDKIISKSDNYIKLKKAVVDVVTKSFEATGSQNIAKRDRTINANFFNTLLHARSFMVEASKVVKNLSEFKSYLSGEPKKAFEQLDIYSRKYPDKTLSEIVNMEEVYRFHEIKDFLQKASLRERLNYHFDNIGIMIEEQNPELKEIFEDIKADAMDLYNTESDKEARIYEMKRIYGEALKVHNCENLIPDVMREIDEMPQVFMSADSFFAQAHKRGMSDGLIISSIFSPRYSTECHLIHATDGGDDKVENKVVLHGACNDMHKRKPFSELMKYHKSLEANIQKQVDIIIESLLNDELPYFLRFYPLRMPINLSQVSNGSIKINVLEYCRKGLKQSQKRAEELSAQLEELYELRDKKIREKLFQERYDSNLADELSAIKTKIQNLENKLTVEEKLQKRMLDQINGSGNK